MEEDLDEPVNSMSERSSPPVNPILNVGRSLVSATTGRPLCSWGGSSDGSRRTPLLHRYSERDSPPARDTVYEPDSWILGIHESKPTMRERGKQRSRLVCKGSM